MKNLSELTYEELCAYTKKVIDSLVLRAYEKGHKDYKEENKLYEKKKKSTTAKFIDSIVEQAKADVREMTLDVQVNLLRPKFVINREKRTIVCLLERFDLGYIHARGIAKCAPDDCFNVHIGKAIALRRALGLKVPDEYLNAPQTTEMRVGDYAKTLKVSRHGSVHAGKFVKIDKIQADGSVVVIPTDEPNNNGIYSPQDLELVTEKPWKKGDKVRHKRTGRVVTVYAYQPEKRTYGDIETGYEFAKVAEGFTYIDEFDYEFWDYIDKYELVTESEYVPFEGIRI